MFKSSLLILLLLFAPVALAAPLHDPTRPPGGAAEAPSTAAQDTVAPVVVSFIMNSPRQRLARVNDLWVAEGDTVAGARVIHIGSGYVRLRRDGQTLNVPIGSGGVSKRPVDARE